MIGITPGDSLRRCAADIKSAILTGILAAIPQITPQIVDIASFDIPNTSPRRATLAARSLRAFSLYVERF